MIEGLLCREDMGEVTERLSQWWGGGDIGRPALLLSCPRAVPAERIPFIPKPEGWITDYSVKDMDYRVYLALQGNASNEFLAEAVPNAAPDLGANCLAMFLGCKPVESPGTVWCEHFLHEPSGIHFDFSEENPAWQASLKLGRALKKAGKGRFLLQFPDLIEGIDTLAAMRGNQELLIDLIDNPEWVHACLDRIFDLYFEVYDKLYEEYKDSSGGSHYWAWAPGRMVKLQCDFSAMISKEMFGEFMLPTLKRMVPRFDRCMYHWDGPGAVQHLEHLVSIEGLDMVQWTPGDGHEPAWDRRWWPNFHRIIDSGKKVFICMPCETSIMEGFKREFGNGVKQFLFGVRAKDRREADAFMRTAEL